MLGDPAEVADAVPIGVGEAADVHLVDDRVAPPISHRPARSHSLLSTCRHRLVFAPDAAAAITRRYRHQEAAGSGRRGWCRRPPRTPTSIPSATAAHRPAAGPRRGGGGRLP